MLDGKKILIVEDDIRAVRNYKFNFSAMEELSQVSVKYAANSKEAISIIEMDDPDLIYLDLSLGESGNLEGVDILKLYSNKFNIIIVSGLDDYAAECSALGARGFIKKPIDFIKMLEEGEKILNSKTATNKGFDITTAVRQVVGGIINEQDAIASTAGSIKLAFEKFQDDPGSREKKDFILNGLEEIRDAAFRANALIQAIKFPADMLTGPVVATEGLDDQLRLKNKGITVHVVEDEEGQCLLYKKALEKAGFLVSFSNNYVDALDHIVKKTPHIVIMDLHFPKSEGSFAGMYGFELIPIISKESKETKLIVISDAVDEGMIEHLKQYHPVRILSKPVAMSQVEAALTAAVSKIQ